ncbi:c-type cytochrome [Hyalangium rubrum]|uniref:Cytochrome c n=1 Tax=Hyalangium rubrum TaxID=3103134 RepID=A0ABU5H0V1_9BACT|nr:cytochrome c [Hyalangium sp. s54d21]MDY7227074.1 cytochrome c [Hyalangium sp. s54d21]
MKMRFALVLSLSLAATAYAEDTADVWKAKCKSCHGEDGAAKTKMGEKEKIPDMTSATWHKNHSDEKIREYIAEGSKKNPKMKPFKDKLTPEQIDSLVKHIRGMEAK